MNFNHYNLVGSSVSTNSFQNMACRNIHVLLVEHETREHDYLINLLHYFSYKVTAVKRLATASSILSKGKVQFDLVMVNMNSPDPLGFQLLEHAAKMKLLVIFMSNVDDVTTTMRALEQGAFLCIRKPLSMVILESLWQFVLSDKARRPKETESFTKLIDYDYSSQEKEYFMGRYILESDQNYSKTNLEEKETGANSGGRYKRKVWTEWTLDLHRKFMAAAKALGQGRCYPREILEIMNVPGLTRMQVASHLQKCRNANWLPPKERKSKAAKSRETPPKKETKAPRARPLRFGVMPFWEEEYSEFHQAIQEYHHQDSMNHPPTAFDHGFYLMGNLDEQFAFGDYQSVAPLTNFSPIEEDPFEFLPIMDSEMVPEFPNFQQDLNEDWDSFILDGGERDQVPDVAAATNQCSHDALNPDMEGGLKVL